MVRTPKQRKAREEVLRKRKITKEVTAKQRGTRSLSKRDREDLRRKELRKGGEFAKDVEGKEREKDVKEVAKRSFEIGEEKERLKLEKEQKGELELGDVIGGRETFGTEEAGIEGAPTERRLDIIPGAQREIMDIQNKLAQPETGEIFDTINRWRLEVKLDNLEDPNRILGGSLPIGIPVGGGTSLGGKAIDGAGRLLGVGQGPQVGGLIGLPSIANNAKNVALTGIWLRRAGFTIKAAAALGGIIGLVAWGKHVKSEAIEFIPFQISKAREAGDEQTAIELEKLFFEIADPTGWANIIEETPGLGVIKAALDKTRVSAEIIKAQKKRS